jgi:molybdate-binding protein
MKAPPCFDDPETKRMIERICEEHQIDGELLKDLCELINNHSGSGRRFGLDDEISASITRFLTRNIDL